jgi:hypothetical protein
MYTPQQFVTIYDTQTLLPRNRKVALYVPRPCLRPNVRGPLFTDYRPHYSEMKFMVGVYGGPRGT